MTNCNRAFPLARSSDTNHANKTVAHTTRIYLANGTVTNYNEFNSASGHFGSTPHLRSVNTNKQTPSSMFQHSATTFTNKGIQSKFSTRVSRRAGWGARGLQPLPIAVLR
jgi:hypothetical protein